MANSLRSITFHSSNVGDRGLTPAQKRRIKEEQGYKCARCKKKFDGRLLEVHHKKSIAGHKSPYGNLPITSMGKKPKQPYDRRSNLEAVCVYCHDKTKKKPKKRKSLV